MACVSPDGKLTASGQAILASTARSVDATDVAAQTGLALFRVRGGLRELVAAGLVTEADGRYVSTRATD
jgi:DNA-binding IclR family transcriptional regulator